MSCGQGRDDDIVDVGMPQAVRAGVVFEGGDDPALWLDRREPFEADALQVLKGCVVRCPGT